MLRDEFLDGLPPYVSEKEVVVVKGCFQEWGAQFQLKLSLFRGGAE
jgi:hypothetical protein